MQHTIAALERDAALHAPAVLPALDLLLLGALHAHLDARGPDARQLVADLLAALQGDLLVLLAGEVVLRVPQGQQQDGRHFCGGVDLRRVRGETGERVCTQRT